VSDLGFMEKLLDGASTEWKRLGEVATKIYSGGTPDTKVGEFWEQGTIPWMSSGEVNQKTVYRTEKFISAEGLKNSSARPVPANSVVIALAGQGKTRGKVARTRIELTTNQSLAAIVCDPRKLSADYVFHFLESQYENLRQISSGNSGRGGLNLKLISDYRVPIPCPDDSEKSLAIQGEIVRILDTFTELTAELTAELAGRKKQYNHYRDQLYCFENTDVEWKILGDVCDFQNGFAFKSSLFLNEGLPIIRIKNVSGGSVNMDDVKYFDPTDYRENTDAFTVEKGDILVAMSGATTGKIGYYAHDFIAYLNQRVGKFLPNVDELNARYLYHFLLSQNQKIYSLAGGGAQPNLSSNALKAKINIPIPYPSDPVRSVAEQERIAIILDKLDTLTTSLSEGLPREIALRQQQYEYYRDLLLSFPKPAEAVEA
jgi:type I restriction enzyme S subunit